MARKTVESMQFQMFFKVGEPHKLLQGRGTHFLDGRELHVVVHQPKDLLGVLVGEAQSPADGLSHAHPDFDVIIESNAVPRLRGGLKGRRLADVVEQDAPC